MPRAGAIGDPDNVPVGVVGSLSRADFGVVGSLSLADIGSPSVDTGNINTGAQFTIGNLFSTVGLGAFAGLPNQIFGPVTFNTGVPGSLLFGNDVFGLFQSTAITEYNTIPGQVQFYVLGHYAPGSYVGLPTAVVSPAAPSPDLASLTISFNQTPAGTGSISDASTFATPPAPAPGVPEPSSMIMALTALAASGLVVVHRRWRGKVVA